MSKMIGKVFSLMLSVICLATFFHPGETHALWSKTFGTNWDENGTLVPAAGGGFYLSMISSDPSVGSGKQYLLFSKLDSSGTVQWTNKIYITDYDRLDISELAAGSVLVQGETRTTSTGPANVVLAKFNVSGSGTFTPVFQKTFGGSGDDSMGFRVSGSGDILGTGKTPSGTINSGANSLTAGSYSDTVTFTNTTNGNGNTTRGVGLTANTTAKQGDLDSSFNGTGYRVTSLTESTGAYAMALQPDGKIVTAGYHGSSLFMVRYLPDGTLDPSFGFGTGMVTSSEADAGYGVAVHNNKIVVVGQGAGSVFVARFDDSGVPDTTFNGTGYVVWDNGYGSSAYGVAIHDDKIIVAGYAWNSNNNDFLLLRYNWDGTLDTGFGTGGAVIIDAIDYDGGAGGSPVFNDSIIGKAPAVQPDGKIVAVVNWSHNASPYAFCLVRVDSAGKIDTSFGYKGGMTLPYEGDVTSPGYGWNGTGDALAIQKDGKILVAGTGDKDPEGLRVVVLRYTLNGYIDTNFGSNGEAAYAGNGYWNFDEWGDSVGGMVLQDDGKIIVAGTQIVNAGTDSSQEDVMVLRFNADGKSLDNSFGDGGMASFNGPLNGDDEGRAVVLQPDGKIIVAGETWKGGDSGSRNQLVLRLIGAPPVLHITPSDNPFNFGSVVVPGSKTQPFAVTNTGGANLVIGQISVTGTNQTNFVLHNDTCSSQTVAPDTGCSFDIVFTPGATTSRTATLSIPSNDPVLNTYNVTLNGTGTVVPPAAIDVSPSPVSFDPTNVGTTATKTVTISNTGGSALNVSSIGVTGGDASMFGVTTGGSNPCGSLTPTVGAVSSCTVLVSFTPGSTGSKSTTLRINSNDTIHNPKDVGVNGTGVVTAPHVEVSPVSVLFGDVDVGTEAHQQLTVSNTGTAPLIVTSPISFTGGDSGMFNVVTGGANACPSLTPTIAASGNCTVILIFTPTSEGLKTTTLRISSNDVAQNPKDVPVSGNGVFLPVTPSKGTIGTLITIKGSGFGIKKGKVLLGGTSLKVTSWTDTTIHCLITKASPLGTAYDVIVQPKNASFSFPKSFAFGAPVIETVSPREGRVGNLISVQGFYFGTSKGKVYLGTKSCKVTKWTMISTTGVSEIQFTVPKGVPLGSLALQVTNAVSNDTDSFKVLP